MLWNLMPARGRGGIQFVCTYPLTLDSDFGLESWNTNNYLSLS